MDIEIETLLSNLNNVPEEELATLLPLVEELSRRKRVEAIQNSLIEFCKHMQKDYIVGVHHKRLASLLQDIEQGEKDRIAVSLAPRHGKSQLISIMMPAWYLGRHPDKKVLMVSHTTDLAVDFGRKVRNLINSDC